MDAAAFGGRYASYGSVLRMADVSLLSGRAAYELLSGKSAVKNPRIFMSFPKRKGCIEIRVRSYKNKKAEGLFCLESSTWEDLVTK